MKKRLPSSFDELIKHHYGTSRRAQLSNAEKAERLFANYYGKPVRKGERRLRASAPVLSLSCDNGEVLGQPNVARFEEYVVSQSVDESPFEEYVLREIIAAPEKSTATSLQMSSAEDVNPAQEYQVDILRPLDRAGASAATPGTGPSPYPLSDNRSLREAAASQSIFSSEELSRTRPSEDDFVKDMQAILSGQKVFDPVTKATVTANELNRSAASSGSVNDGGRPIPEAANEQAIFDRIAQSMEYANKYDLGTVELENRFSDFDRISELQQKAKETKSKNGRTPSGQSSPAATVDSADFIQDLDAIQKQRSATSAQSDKPAPSLSAATETGTVPTTNIEFENRNLAEVAAISTVLSSPTYDRKGALEYARKFWLLPCDDQFIALSASAGKDFQRVPAGTKLEHEFDGTISKQREHAVLPDGTRIEWAALDDCTHFISCCIGERNGEPCGNLPIPYKQLGEPPEAPYGIVRVSTMVDFLTGNKVKGVKYAEIVAEKSEDEKLISTLSPGDLIAYFHKKNKQYSHLTMYLGDNKIACHTYSRSDLKECTWDNIWNIGVGTHQWTFIRFTV